MTSRIESHCCNFLYWNKMLNLICVQIMHTKHTPTYHWVGKVSIHMEFTENLLMRELAIFWLNPFHLHLMLFIFFPNVSAFYLFLIFQCLPVQLHLSLCQFFYLFVFNTGLSIPLPISVFHISFFTIMKIISLQFSNGRKLKKTN